MNPIYIPNPIYRPFIAANQEKYTFLYSAPVSLLKSYGQIAEALDSCCFPIPVRYSTCTTHGYFSDNAMEDAIGYIDTWMKDIPKDKPIIPFPNIGRGGSRLSELAPKVFKYIQERLDAIKYGNIVYTSGADIRTDKPFIL